MKLIITTFALIGCLFSANSAARDDLQTLPVEALLQTTKAKNALLDIPLYFASQSHSKIKSSYGEVITNKKGDQFGRLFYFIRICNY